MKFLPIDWVYWAMNFSYGWICRSSNEYWMSHFLFVRIHISIRSLSLFRSLYPCWFFCFSFFLWFLLIAMSTHVRPFFPYNSFYTRWVRAVRCMKLELWNFLSVFRHRAQKSTDFYRANNFSYYTPLDYNNVQRILCAPVLPFNALGFGLMYEENDREHTLTRKMYTLFGKFYIVRLDCVSTPYIYLRNILPYSSFSHIFHSRSVLFLICGNIISITHDFSVYNEKGIIFHDVNPSETYFWVKRWIKRRKEKNNNKNNNNNKKMYMIPQSVDYGIIFNTFYFILFGMLFFFLFFFGVVVVGVLSDFFFLIWFCFVKHLETRCAEGEFYGE